MDALANEICHKNEGPELSEMNVLTDIKGNIIKKMQDGTENVDDVLKLLEEDD